MNIEIKRDSYISHLHGDCHLKNRSVPECPHTHRHYYLMIAL